MMLPKIGTPNLAELELPEMAMMTEESFNMDEYPTEREDLGYLANQAQSDNRNTSYGEQTGRMDSRQTDVRENRTQRSRTEGDTQRSSSVDNSNSRARSEASPADGEATSTRVDQGNSSVMNRMSEFQAAMKKMTQNRNLGRVDRRDQGARSLGKAKSGNPSEVNTDGAEKIAGAAGTTNAAKASINAAKSVEQARANQIRQVAEAGKAASKAADTPMNGKSGDSMLMDMEKANNTGKATTVSKVSLAKLSESPEVRDLIKNLKMGESNETILRMEDTEAGNLEVHIRMDGSDLAVQIRAEDVGLRGRMLDRIGNLEEALRQENLVDGQVNVSEYDMNGDSQAQQGQERQMEGGMEQKENNVSVPSGEAKGPYASSHHDGLVHIVA